MPGGHNRVDIDIDELRAAYEEDRQAVRKVAEKYGVTVQCVYLHMNRAGLKRRPPGDASKGTQSRENNPNWKNGTTRTKRGYIMEQRDGKRYFQHRLVAEEMLGRKLRKGECVHHKNGNPSDNRPENLEVMESHAAHMKEHCDSETMREKGRKGLASRYGH